jgi:hypothetical protein
MEVFVHGQLAGLVETLKGKGPFTVFAPSDEAFAKLPAGTLDNLLKSERRRESVGLRAEIGMHSERTGGTPQLQVSFSFVRSKP